MTTKNIVIAIVSIIIITGAVYGMLSRKDIGSDAEVKLTPSKSEQTNSQNRMVFDGEGRKTIGPVSLKSGLVILKAKNQSGSNSSFSVNVYKDENGNGTLEDGEGYTGSNISVGYENAESFNGAIALKSSGGNYFAEIEGGRWQIIFAPSDKLLEPAKIDPSFSGNGIQVTDKFYLSEGKYSFHAINKGGGNFLVYLVDENGNFTSRLVNELYDFEGDFTINNVFDGNYMFAITGGDWTITKNK